MDCIAGLVFGASDMESWFARQDQQQGNTLQKLLGSVIQHEDVVFV